MGIPIKKVSNKHEAIMNMLIAEPEKPHKVMAAEIGVTQSWFSTVVNSAVFQAELRAKQGDVFTDSVVIPIKDKLMGTAHLATERLNELIPISTDVKAISDTMDKALKNLGYHQPTTGVAIIDNSTNITQNTITKEDLLKAQRLVGAARQATEEIPLEETETLDVPRVRDDNGSGMGQRNPQAALFPKASVQEGEFQEGASLRADSIEEAP